MTEIRKYISGEEEALWAIYFGAVRNVCIRDYTDEQVKAWAPDEVDMDSWREKIRQLNPYVAVLEGEIVGYADLQHDGCIDHFFIDCQYQRRGVGNDLMVEIIANAQSKGISKLYSHVSKTAKDFYLAQGFKVFRDNTVTVRGVDFTNFIMERKVS
ncbi:MAG: GNAT family N-acetyltransferase [Phormidesmis sp.]